MAGKIFINYRRGDDPGHTGRLFDRLQDVFEPQQLFLDVDNIAPGLDFVRVLNERVAECDVVLAIIGKGWIDARNAAGARRLDDPDDFVRVEIASALNQGKRVIPVLVGDAPMPRPEDLPEAIRPLARRNAVRLTHERFRADTQGLIKALQQGLDEIEALRKAEQEAARRAQAEGERRRQEAEAARRTEEEEHRKKAEAEAQERAAEERRRQEAAAKQHAEEERAFTAAAKRVGTVTDIDAFLAAHPESHRVAEAQKLKAALLAREEAYRHAMASDDSALLKSFLEIYQKGADTDQLRTRLRRLEPKQSARPSAQALIIPGALAIMLVAGLVVWFETRSSPNTQQVSAVSSPPVPTTLAATPAVRPAALPPQSAPVLSPAAPTALPAGSVPPEPPGKVAESALAPSPDEVAWSLLKETTDEAALKRFIAQYPNSAVRKDADARIAALEAAQVAKPVSPSPDEAAWALLKETTDDAALKRFTTQYPDSALRKDAEARIAALAAAQAAKPVPPRPDEVTWALLKETTDEGALKRFTAQYPKSALRKDAETRIAALEAAQAAKPVPPGPDEVTWAMLKETTDEAALKRFTSQYPKSPLRKEAEGRIAALAAAQAAKPAPPSSDEVTWTLLKETTDETALRRFTAQYPKSPLRKDAEARIAALETAAKAAPVNLTDPHELARSLQFELKRVGCFNGAVNGEFDDATKAAWRSFSKHASITLSDDLSSDAINAVRKIDKRICPQLCPDGQRAEGDRCVAAQSHGPKIPGVAAQSHGPKIPGNADTKCLSTYHNGHWCLGPNGWIVR
jgi:outer membrane protein assembly factor BamD (BamD/ComL family)